MERPGLVSVIVTTRNSARTLAQCLASIRDQSYTGIDLIVVDNSSTDATLDIARSAGANVVRAGPERSAQRNVGIAHARGEYVFIADADMLLAPNVIGACIAAIANAGAVAVPEVSEGEGFWSACKAFERSFYVNDEVVSAARFFRTADVRAAGGYDERLLGGEDWDLSMRLTARTRLAFADAVIRHDEGRLTPAQAFMKKRYYAAGVRRFLSKHGRAGWRRISPARAGLFSHPRRLFARPLLTLGMLTLKAVEALGVLTGMLRRDHAAQADRVYQPH